MVQNKLQEISYRSFASQSTYSSSLNLQKALYLNVCVYPVWWAVVAFFLNSRFYNLETLSRYFSTAVLAASIFIESIRLYLGYCGNLYNQVPELAGFWMLTILMQLPVMSFFLFNPYLGSTPTEVTLHSIIYLLLLAQLLLGYFALKRASAYAKSVYLSYSTLPKDQ